MRLLDISEVQAIQLELMKKLHLFLQDNNIKYYLIAGSALGAVRHQGFIPWDDDIDIGMFRDDYEKFLKIASQFGGQYEVVNYRNSKICDYALTRIYINHTMVDNITIKNTKLDSRLYFDVFPLDVVPENNSDCVKLEKNILRYKKLISFMDVRDYGNRRLVLLGKKIISCFLSTFRQSVISKCEKEMTKYYGVNTGFVCSLCSQYKMKKQKMPIDVYGAPVLHRFEDCEFYVPMKINVYLETLYGSDYMQIPPESKRRKGYNIYEI